MKKNKKDQIIFPGCKIIILLLCVAVSFNEGPILIISNNLHDIYKSFKKLGVIIMPTIKILICSLYPC